MSDRSSAAPLSDVSPVAADGVSPEVVAALWGSAAAVHPTNDTSNISATKKTKNLFTFVPPCILFTYQD
jgi:hypothetical protein